MGTPFSDFSCCLFPHNSLSLSYRIYCLHASDQIETPGVPAYADCPAAGVLQLPDQ